MSIQSLILVEKPYFNEPGYESAIGTPKGEQQSAAYNEVIRAATIKWAMLDIIKSPPPAFAEVVRIHFSLKKDRVLREVRNWLTEAKESHKGSAFASASAAYIDNLSAMISDLEQELNKLSS